jgi:hypothetical protein
VQYLYYYYPVGYVDETYVYFGKCQSMRGSTGAGATFTEVNASVDANTGTPNVTVTLGGTTTEKTLDFAFKNLKGEKGDKPVKGQDYFTDAEINEIAAQAAGKVELDADLTAIANLTGTGLLKKTAANTWALDANTYLTSNNLAGYATEDWVTKKGYTTNIGTVTSVGLSVPTGFSVGNSPVTGSGTLTLSFADGYSLPTTVKQTNWDTAYGWGNHANAGYIKSFTDTKNTAGSTNSDSKLYLIGAAEQSTDP